MGESDQTWGTVVGEVDKHLVLWSGLQNSSVSSLDSGLVGGQDCDEVGWGDVIPFIINTDTSVDVIAWKDSAWLVVDSSWEWVLFVIGNIVIGHNDDVFSRNTIGGQDLERVEHIRLMSVVGISVRSGNQDGVVGAHDARAQEQD